MRRLLLVLIAVLAIVPNAYAWTWPTDGPVLAQFSFDRLYDNFGRTISAGAAAAVSRSAARYTGWIRGDFDQLT